LVLANEKMVVAATIRHYFYPHGTYDLFGERKENRKFQYIPVVGTYDMDQKKISGSHALVLTGLTDFLLSN
jgi:hypothetical protein